MQLNDTLHVLRLTGDKYDADYNPVAQTEEWVEFGKCFISFNSSAQKMRLADGTEYVYSYYVLAPLNKERYELIPEEGDKVRIIKADGTIDREMEVKGFVTYKNSWLKIWL